MRALNPCLRALVLAVPMALVACGGEDDAGPTVQEDANKLSFSTGEFEVPAGDSFTCFYLDKYTEQDLAVVDAYGDQGVGGHHILVYYSEENREPGHHECSDVEMVNLKQISGSGGQDGTAAEGSVIKMPDGLALKVPKGKQLVLQAHYINTSGAPMKVNDTVTLELGDPAKIKGYVNYLATIDFDFKVPPQAEYTKAGDCVLDRDYDIVNFLGHMHEEGAHYRMDAIAPDGSMTTLRDDKWEALYTSHPPISEFTMDEPLHLAKGTTLRQTCTWNNTKAEPLMFPTEMCVGFFYYFPAAGDFECEMKAVEAEE